MRRKHSFTPAANYNLGLKIRADPTTNGKILATLCLGDSFTVVDGPECNSSLSWWKVQLDDGAFGWVGEGNDYYLIAPINLTRAQLPGTFSTDCPLAPPTQLKVGQRAVIGAGARSGAFLYRDQNAKFKVGALESGPEVQIIGGPIAKVRPKIIFAGISVSLMEREQAVKVGWPKVARKNAFFSPSKYDYKA